MIDGERERPTTVWSLRADLAEQAVRTRHLRRLYGIPGTRIGLASWPSRLTGRLHLNWNYWWQAHLLDCLVDAQYRAPDLDRKAIISALLRGIQIRNLGGWTNRYYDDIAWMGLAIQRSARYAEVDRPRAVDVIARRLRSGWTEHGGGGIWWRRGDDYKNVPANGPAAIFLARLASLNNDSTDLHRAMSAVDWIEEWLVDQDKGLVLDGLRVDKSGEVYEVSPAIYSYCQGVFLGACVELAELDSSPLWAQLAKRTVLAVGKYLVNDQGVLYGHGDGDGGLFAGILVRYLAQAALRLTDLDAAQLVYQSAQSAWQNRGIAKGYPVFGEQWSEKTELSRRNKSSTDLSVQLSGWMTLEAAALLERKWHPAVVG